MTQPFCKLRGRRSPRSRANAAGLSLIELLVAVTIGGILIFGATQVYVDSRNMYEINESTARLQETARYAISVLEPDIRMSNYWGLVKGAGVITAPAGAPNNDCGPNFARDLGNNLAGSNNTYSLTCAPSSSLAVGSADTLVVRRASTAVNGPEVNRLQVCSTRVMGRLMHDGGAAIACPAAPAGQINDLRVNAYFVARGSDQSATLPSLRRKALVLGPAFTEEEIIPGIEDMQIQFGVDPTGLSGTATRYVNPDSVPAGAQIVSVRLWLLVRSETPEVGFTDNRIYEYGDRDGSSVTNDLNAAGAATQAYQPGDNFRRLLVSRTIQIRNALGT